MKTVVVGGAEVAYRDAGDGPPILFLHGNPDTSSIWAPTIGRLADRHRCLAPDLPGFGGSAPVPGFDYSFAGLAAWVDGFVAATGVATPVDLVVHDIGGPYGLAWAIRHPDKVRRIAITNTIFHPDYRWHLWARIWRTRWLGELSMALMNWPMFAFTTKIGAPGLSFAAIRETYRSFVPGTRREVLRFYRATDPRHFAEWEPALLALTRTKPTRVLWGDRDPFVQRRFAERFGTADVEHFDAAGHWVAAEAPDAFADRLRQHFG